MAWNKSSRACSKRPLKSPLLQFIDVSWFHELTCWLTDIINGFIKWTRVSIQLEITTWFWWTDIYKVKFICVLKELVWPLIEGRGGACNYTTCSCMCKQTNQQPHPHVQYGTYLFGLPFGQLALPSWIRPLKRRWERLVQKKSCIKLPSHSLKPTTRTAKHAPKFSPFESI